MEEDSYDHTSTKPSQCSSQESMNEWFLKKKNLNIVASVSWISAYPIVNSNTSDSD